MYDSWYIIYLWYLHPRYIYTCGMYIPGIFIFIPESTYRQAFQNTLHPSYELLGAHQYIPHSTSRPMTGNPINSTTNVLCIGGLGGFPSEVPSGATGCRGIPPCGMLRDPGTSHVGSRGFPRYPGLDLAGYRGIPRYPMGSHMKSLGMSRGGMGIHVQVQREPSVGIPEITWDAMGLGLVIRLGFSQELTGTRRKNKARQVGCRESNAGLHRNSRELVGAIKTTHGTTREPVHPRGNPQTSRTILWYHAGQRVTWDPVVLFGNRSLHGFNGMSCCK